MIITHTKHLHKQDLHNTISLYAVSVDFSLEDNAEMSAPRRIRVDNKNSNNCQVSHRDRHL